VIKHWLNKLDILKVKIKALELDNELAYRPLIKDLLEGRGVTIEPSAPRTQAQNGGAERSGGVLMAMAMPDFHKKISTGIRRSILSTQAWQS